MSTYMLVPYAQPSTGRWLIGHSRRGSCSPDFLSWLRLAPGSRFLLSRFESHRAAFAPIATVLRCGLRGRGNLLPDSTVAHLASALLGGTIAWLVRAGVARNGLYVRVV